MKFKINDEIRITGVNVDEEYQGLKGVITNFVPDLNPEYPVEVRTDKGVINLKENEMELL